MHTHGTTDNAAALACAYTAGGDSLSTVAGLESQLGDYTTQFGVSINRLPHVELWPLHAAINGLPPVELQASSRHSSRQRSIGSHTISFAFYPNRRPPTTTATDAAPSTREVGCRRLAMATQ